MSGKTKFGNRSNCKVCSSPNRLEADRRLLDGEPALQVSKWLRSLGETPSHNSVASHKKNHLAVTQQARERIAATEQQAADQVEKAVQRVVANVKLLNELAGTHMRIIRDMTRDGHRPDDGGDDAMPSVVLFNSCAKEARECVKARYEILQGKKVKLDGLGGLAGLLGDALDEEEQAEEAGPEAPGPLGK